MQRFKITKITPAFFIFLAVIGLFPSGVSLANMKIGLIADTHLYADNASAYTVNAMNKMATWAPDVIGCLGDIIVDASDANYPTYMADFSSKFVIGETPRIIVVGNHDVRQAWFSTVQGACPSDVKAHLVSGELYGSFDYAGFHFVMLDENYNPDTETRVEHSYADGYIPVSEQNWLISDLAVTNLPIIVFGHYCIGTPGLPEQGDVITNASTIRSILETSGKVVAVFNGQVHANQSALVNGIPYFTITSVYDQTYSTGFTVHNKGSHAQVTINTTSKTISVETYEDDSVKGYLLVDTTILNFSAGATNYNDSVGLSIKGNYSQHLRGAGVGVSVQ